jgi:hypothetical protein
MGTVNTPSNFAHNAWVSNDGTHVYTTDEVSNGYIGAYNVTDPSNMFETDRIRSSTGSDVIPHNVHVLNDFLITSYYSDGIVIHDAKYPDKLFEVANFDTSPNFSGSGYNGSWGAYPFLPSGVILASDIEEGLYILNVDYTRAAFLEGVVISATTGMPLFNAKVEILGTGLVTQTAFDGTYEFGTLLSGTVDIEFSKLGYVTQVVTGVEIINGEISLADAELNTLAVGVNDLDYDNKLMNLFPNPFSGSATLDYDVSSYSGRLAQVSVYNLLGSEVQQLELFGAKGTIRLGNELPAGVYFVRLESEGKVLKTSKIIKH